MLRTVLLVGVLLLGLAALWLVLEALTPAPSPPGGAAGVVAGLAGKGLGTLVS